MDLKEILDEAAHAGPAHRPVAERLTAGRRAVRLGRLRAGAGLAALAVMAAAGWAVLPERTPAVVATERDGSGPAVAPAAPVWPSQDSWAAIDGAGRVTVRPDVEVRGRFDDVVDGRPSVALDLVRGDDHRFVLLWLNTNGVVSEVVEPGIGELNEFVVDTRSVVDGDLPMAVGTGGDYASLPLVAYRGGELWVVPGAEIVVAVSEPVRGWCGVWPSHAVEIAYEGDRYFAALTEGNCGGSFTKAVPGDTLEEFVATFASTNP